MGGVRRELALDREALLKTVECVQNELVQPRVIEPKLSEFDALLEEAPATKPTKSPLVEAAV